MRRTGQLRLRLVHKSREEKLHPWRLLTRPGENFDAIGGRLYESVVTDADTRLTFASNIGGAFRLLPLC